MPKPTQPADDLKLFTLDDDDIFSSDSIIAQEIQSSPLLRAPKTNEPNPNETKGRMLPTSFTTKEPELPMPTTIPQTQTIYSQDRFDRKDIQAPVSNIQSTFRSTQHIPAPGNSNIKDLLQYSPMYFYRQKAILNSEIARLNAEAARFAQADAYFMQDFLKKHGGVTHLSRYTVPSSTK